MRKVLSRFLLPVVLCISLLPTALVFALDDTQPLPETLLVPPATQIAQQENAGDPAAAPETDPIAAPEPATAPAVPDEDPTKTPETPAEEKTTNATEPSTAASAAIHLSQSDVRIGQGEAFYLFAQDESGRTVSVSYTVGDTGVLQQTMPGCFTAAAPGQTTVTAHASDGAAAGG